MKIRGQKILITGGGSGIGLSIADELIALGNNVIICGRNEQKLMKASNGVKGLEYFICDINNQSQMEALTKYVINKFKWLNILINNAGLGFYYDINKGNFFDKARQEIQTNYLGIVNLTESFLPYLKMQSEAAIINISSGLAYVPSKYMMTYSASKAAVHSFSQSLRISLKETTVKVFEVIPPFVDTELVSALRIRKKLKPDVIAKQMIKGIQNDKYEIRIANINALYNINRIYPKLAQNIIDKLFY